MQAPLQIRSGDIPLTPEVVGYIRERLARMETAYTGLVSCRVTLDAPLGHHRKGGPFEVTIDVAAPGTQLIVSRQSDPNLHAAIRHAFDAMHRQVEDYARRQRGQVKASAGASPARVLRLFPDEGYGFLDPGDGREVYFHRNAVLAAAFDALAVGDEVHFSEELGDNGPQASSVTRAG